jgi:ATP-dependent DNA helicase 2 subunit 1
MNQGFEPNPAELFAFLSEEKDIGGDLGEEGGVSSVGAAVSETGRGAVMFCVDCSDVDWSSGQDIQSAFSVISRYMRNQIIASDGSEMTGLILYNVASAKNPLRQRGIHVVHDLSGLTALRIRETSDLASLTENKFAELFGGSTKDSDISDLIFVCNAQFRKVSAAYTPRIIIFTKNDEPCGTDRKAHQAALTRANDFLNAMPNSQIQLIPFGQPEEFDVGKFWAEMLRIDSESDQFQSEAVRFISDVQSHTLKKLFRKRPVNRVNLYLSPDASDPVALMMYTSFYPASKPRQMYVDGDTMKPVRSESRYISEATGAVLDPEVDAGEIITYVEFNKIQVPMTRHDVDEIRRLWTPPSSAETGGITGHLQLVGFQEATKVLKPEHCVGHAAFLYPQDSRIEGSAELVSALIQVLSEHNLVAIARAVPRSNATMNFVALIPQQERLDEDTGELLLSPGFHMLRLPFADDIRDLSLPNTNVAYLMSSMDVQERARLAQVECAKKVVDAMTEPNWDPEMLDNPSLRVCFATLENLALGIQTEDSDNTVVDIVNPDGSKVMVADELSREWLGSMGLETTDSVASGSVGAVVPKRVRVQEGTEWTESEVRKMLEGDQLSRLTARDLQSIIEKLDAHKQVNTRGTKAELIKKIAFLLKQ